MPLRVAVSVWRLRASRSTFHKSVFYSTQPSTNTETPAPPLLLRFKADLKSAMKAKDTNRLSVLRGMLADITNASKTSTPVKTDMQVLTLLRKRAGAAEAAAEEFRKAQRGDLVEKEDAQRTVLEEYASNVETIGEDEVRSAIQGVVDEMKAADGKVDKGRLLKRLIGPGGVFEGRNVEKSMVVKTAQEVAAM